jgi:hypothetical protein
MKSTCCLHSSASRNVSLNLDICLFITIITWMSWKIWFYWSSESFRELAYYSKFTPIFNFIFSCSSVQRDVAVMPLIFLHSQWMCNKYQLIHIAQLQHVLVNKLNWIESYSQSIQTDRISQPEYISLCFVHVSAAVLTIHFNHFAWWSTILG